MRKVIQEEISEHVCDSCGAIVDGKSCIRFDEY